MVTTYTPPDYSTQAESGYPTFIDAAIAVLREQGGQFAAHQVEPTADDTVLIDAGRLYIGGDDPIEVAQQQTTAFTFPTVNPRIDRIVIDRFSGAYSVITGVEAASPSAPAITDGLLPIARVNLSVGQTEITNADIDEERDLRALGGLLINKLQAISGDAAIADQVAIYDDNLSVERRAALDALFTVINALGNLATPAVADEVPIFDQDGTAPKSRKIRLDNLLKVIDSLTEDTAPAGTDFLLSYDTSASAVKKIAKSQFAGADIQIFTQGAAQTWTKPSGKTHARVWLWAGGGSGAQTTRGGGGGGGGFRGRWFRMADLGATETVNVGAGGAAVTTTGTNGNAGSNSTFGSLLTAYAGAGALDEGGGGGGTTSAGSGTTGGGPSGGGLGGGDSVFGGGGGGNVQGGKGGESNFQGSGGGAGHSSGTGGIGGYCAYGGAGGGGAGTTAGGNGGDSMFGGDGGAGGNNSTAGADGATPAGGGGGAINGNDSGAGGDGLCIVISV